MLCQCQGCPSGAAKPALWSVFALSRPPSPVVRDLPRALCSVRLLLHRHPLTRSGSDVMIGALCRAPLVPPQPGESIVGYQVVTPANACVPDA